MLSLTLWHRFEMDSPGGLKRACFHLGDQDRAAIERIRERLDLPSSALAIRYALRTLDKRLAENPPRTMVEAALLLGGKEVSNEK